MKTKFIKTGILFLVIAGLLGGVHAELSAASYDQFSVSAVIPENQVDKSKSYFDLRMSPNMEQEIQVTVNNSGDKTMKAAVSLNDATTGNNGEVIYSQPGDRDSSLSLSTTDVTSVLDKEVTIEPGKSTNVRLKIVMPSEEFDGQLLGAVVITGSTDEEVQQDPDKTVAIENEVAYVVGLNLSMNENEVSSNLNLMKVKENLVDHRISVTANIQNDRPILMSEVVISGTIKKKGSDVVLSKVDIEAAKIAPHTNFNVVYDWNEKAIENGTYRIQMKATYGESVWEWDEEFEVKNADKVNEDTFFIEKSEPNWFLVIGGVLLGGILLGGLFVFLIAKKKKNKEEKK